MQYSSFSELIKKEYLDRKRNHPHYSERAFARDLHLSPGFLKLFFQGKKNISIERAVKICRYLNWSEVKIKLALNIIQKSKINLHLKPDSLAKKYLQIQKKLSLGEFSILSDWYYFGIIELCDLFPSGLTRNQIKENLGITQIEAEYAVDQLISKGLLAEKKMNLFRVNRDYGISAQSSDIIRKFHRQILNKSLKAIDSQDLHERENIALTLSFESKRMNEAKAMIEKFINDFNSNFENGQKDTVYQLAVSFFKLNKQGESI